MPKAGLEPARLAAPPPQDGVSANSTTSARLTTSEPISFPAQGALLESRAESPARSVVAGPARVVVAVAVVVAVVAAAIAAVSRFRE